MCADGPYPPAHQHYFAGDGDLVGHDADDEIDAGTFDPFPSAYIFGEALRSSSYSALGCGSDCTWRMGCESLLEKQASVKVMACR